MDIEKEILIFLFYIDYKENNLKTFFSIINYYIFI